MRPSLEKFNNSYSTVAPEEMDDIDRKLLILIGVNPRVHLQELAEKLGISRQAVNHRMQLLTESGVIRGMSAGISISYLNAVPVAISGISRRASMDDTLDRLGESELTRRALVAAGNYLYVVGFLRNIHELNGYVDFVRRAADMTEPLVGVYCLDDGLTPSYPVDGSGSRPKKFKELSPLDLRIIASLRDNACRPIADVSRMVGASAKTVRRHLERMISEGTMDMTATVDLASGGDLLIIMHINLKNGADKIEFGKKLLAKRSFRDEYIRTHANLPSLVIWVFWSNKIGEIRRVLREVSENEQVESAMINIAYFERMYPTWRDKLAEAQMRHNEKAGTQKSQSRSR